MPTATAGKQILPLLSAGMAFSQSGLEGGCVSNKKSSPKLPGWFNLNKYQAAKEFGLCDWGFNLQIRSSLLKTETSDEYSSQCRALIHQYGAIPKEEFQADYKDEVAMYEYHTGSKNNGLVYGMPIWRAYEVYTEIKWDTALQHDLALIDYKQVFNHQRKAALNDEEKELELWHDQHFKEADYNEWYGELSHFSPIVCVELDSSDEMLIAGFKAWLAGARAEREKEGWSALATKKNFRRANFEKWCQYGVLPYLDLKIFEMEMGKKIPLHVIGNAIYSPDLEIDTTEAVRKTTANYAAQALTACNALISQGIAEARLHGNMEEKGA